MYKIYQILCLSSVFIVVKSFQSNCQPLNQFRSFCIPLEYCTEFRCDYSKCGYFPRTSSLVKIQGSKIIPTCAFSNSDKLRDIDGVQRRIEIIASESFVNLPNLRSILLSFNFIRELHRGIFLDVSVKTLDLSWNKIAYIADGAFQGLSGLQYLNLSKNELQTLPNTPMPSGLIELNLSNNFIDIILMTSKKTPNILKIDLSHNILQKVAFSFDHDVKKIELSNNELKALDFIEITSCEEFKLGSNLFSSVPEILVYLNIQRISLYPNPWICFELHNLWKYLENNDVIIINEDAGSKRITNPICQASVEAPRKLNININLNKIKNCISNNECDNNMICRTNECWNPCAENFCDSTSICQVKNHEVKCSCPEKLRRNPKDVYSICHNVECFLDNDCIGEGEYCGRNNSCFVSSHVSYPKPKRPNGHGDLTSILPWWYEEIPKINSSNLDKHLVYN